MDKLKHYREIIKQLLTEYRNLGQPQNNRDLEDSIAFDQERDHYFWFEWGWEDQRRVRGITVYIRIKNDKIWVEEDWTDLGVVDDLLAAGIPKEDIVLGFHPPSERALTEFAIA